MKKRAQGRTEAGSAAMGVGRAPSAVRRLLAWFAGNKRALPWRHEPRDPYRVWLSEVMLQQTQVTTVIPYFERWLARFPTLAEFAAAPLDDVLKHWEGLGYYSRARNFHKAAQHVMQEHGGRIPDTVDGLLALPGVGRYTAGAIASLAFGRDAAVVDGNVKRVIGRLYAIADPDADLWPIVAGLLPTGEAGAFNEALMELGATVCTPKTPRCPDCPLTATCAALAQGNPARFPLKRAKPATPHYDIATAVIRNRTGALLLGQRPAEGLLGGLWEFVSDDLRATGPSPDADAIVRMVERRVGLHVTVGATLGSVKHAFTHFKITRHVWLCEAGARTAPTLQCYATLRWVQPAALDTLALTRADQHIAALLKANPHPAQLRFWP
jgi:A/G-specific adenine glycosylase